MSEEQQAIADATILLEDMKLAAGTLDADDIRKRCQQLIWLLDPSLPQGLLLRVKRRVKLDRGAA